MADEKLQYTLVLNTVATGTGAQRTAEEMERLARATNNATDKARVSEFAYYDLDSEITKTRKSTETFTAGQTQVQSSTRNSAQALLMFSQGFEDASYGVRGILNNIPGLVIALGGTAGLAGAISIAAVSLSQIIPLFQETEEKASDVADRIQQISDNMGEMETERFEQVADSIDAARDRAAALKQEFDDTRAAENAFAVTALDNTAKLAQAQRNVAEALGKQVDSYKELQAIAAAEEQKRKVAAEQAIAAEQQKLSTADEAVTQAADYLQKQRQRAAIEEANLVSMRAQLDTLREQKAVLDSIAAGGGNLKNLPPSLQEFSADALKSSRNFTDYSAAVRAEAGRQANDPALLTALEGMDARVASLETAIQTLTKDGGIVEKAENAFLTAQTQLADLTSAVATNIESIQNTLAADNLLARTQAVAQSTEQQAKDLSAAIAQITTTTAAGEAAKQTIQAAAADGRITADETQRVAQATSQLIAQIQGGLATAGENTKQVLVILRNLAEQEARNGREIMVLKRQVDQLFSRIR